MSGKPAGKAGFEPATIGLEGRFDPRKKLVSPAISTRNKRTKTANSARNDTYSGEIGGKVSRVDLNAVDGVVVKIVRAAEAAEEAHGAVVQRNPHDTAYWVVCHEGQMAALDAVSPVEAAEEAFSRLPNVTEVELFRRRGETTHVMTFLRGHRLPHQQVITRHHIKKHRRTKR